MSKSKSLAFYLDPDELGVRKRKRNLKFSRAGGCLNCPGQAGAKSPKMNPCGSGHKRIMLVGESPGRSEDAAGMPFVGPSGEFLSDALHAHGIDMGMGCLRTNVVQCFLSEQGTGKKALLTKCVKKCLPRVEQQIRDMSPKLILALGGVAAKTLLDPPSGFAITKVRGLTIPSWKYNCWIGCLLHPAFVLRSESNSYGAIDTREVFYRDMAACLEYLNRDIADVPVLTEQGYQHIFDFEEAKALLVKLSQLDTLVAFDYETTGLNPFAADFQLYSVAFAFEEGGELKRYFLPLAYNSTWDESQLAAIMAGLKTFLLSDTSKCLQSWDYEQRCSFAVMGIAIKNVVYDTMVGHHIVDQRKGTCGLAHQTFVNFGVKYKSKIDFSKVNVGLLDNLPAYNALDAGYTLLLSKKQRLRLAANPALVGAYDFFHKGIPVLSEMSANGIGLDIAALQKMKTEAEAEIEEVEARLAENEITVAAKRSINFGSNNDVRWLLFARMRLTPVNVTDKKVSSVDVETLEAILRDQLNAESVAGKLLADLMRLRKLSKFVGTYLKNLIGLSDQGAVIHPTYHLHTTETYRSSSSDPNWQTQPIRDEEFKKIREAVVPARGDAFLEGDFGGAEVRVIGMFSKDPKLTRYIQDVYDFHKEWAAKCFQVPIGQVDKAMRYRGKNEFVFPNFYGAIYQSIARNMGLDENFIAVKQREFWSEFPEVKAWQNKTIDFYRRHGYVETPLGFRRRAPLDFRKIINTPVQGTSFHLLMAGLVEGSRTMHERGLRSKLVSQVHDSVLIDLFIDEVDEVVAIMNKALQRKRYDWMGEITMQVDWSVGYNWHDMKELDL